MLKCVGLNATTGKKALILGLSRANLNNLAKGFPIQFDAEVLDADLHLEVVIMAGQTEESMVQELIAAGFAAPANVEEHPETEDHFGLPGGGSREAH
jgi:hypothetical protein